MIPQMQGKILPNDYCSQFQAEIEVCEICGMGVLQPFIETEGENEVHIYCQNCAMTHQTKPQEKPSA